MLPHTSQKQPSSGGRYVYALGIASCAHMNPVVTVYSQVKLKPFSEPHPRFSYRNTPPRDLVQGSSGVSPMHPMHRI